MRKGKEDSVRTLNWSGAWYMYSGLASYNLWFFARDFCIQQNATFVILVGGTVHRFTQHQIDVHARDFAFAMAPETLFERWAVQTSGTTEQGLDNFQLPHFDLLDRVIFVLVVVVMVVMLAHHQTLIKQKMLVQHLGRSWKIT